MTLDEFFEKLPRDGWMLNGEMEIRCRDDADCCPWLRVNRTGAIPGGTSWTPLVWHAADNDKGHDKALRARLLEHCGL